MDEEQQTISEIQTIPEEILKEIEKVGKLEKGVKGLQKRTSIMYGDIADIKQKLDKSSSENIIDDYDEESDKDNVIGEKLSATLTSIEKERYKKIGEEFIKGIEEPLDKFKKAAELKEKMKTNTAVSEIQKQIKPEETQKKKKDKSGWLAKLALIIGTLGIAVLLFEDKIKKMFPDISSDISESIGGMKEKVFDKFSEIFYNIVGVHFGGIIGDIIKKDIPLVVRTLFYTILPQSIEKSVLAVMSAFSASAREQHEQSVSQTEIAIDESKRQYDQARLNQQAQEDMMRIKSGEYSSSELLTTKGRLAASQIIDYDSYRGLSGDNSIQTMLAQMYGRTLFGETTLDEAKAFIFEDNNPITRTLMGVMNKNNNELKSVLEDNNLTVDEIKNTVVPLLAQAAGISQDDSRYSTFEEDVLNRFGNNSSVAASQLQHLIAVSTQFTELGITQQQNAARAELQATTAERTSQRAKITLNGMTPEAMRVEFQNAVTNDEIATQVHDFYTNIINAFSSPDLADFIVKGVNEIFNFGITNVVTRAFDMFDIILNGIPPVFRQYEGLAKASNIMINYENNTINESSFNAALGSSDRPVVVVNIPITDAIVDDFTNLTQTRVNTLQKITDTNTKLEQLIQKVSERRKVEGKEITMEAVDQIVSDIVSKNNVITETKFFEIDTELLAIKTYLENNDTDDDSTKNFAPIQAASTAS